MERRIGHTDITPNDTLAHRVVDPIKPLPYPLPNGEWALDLSSHLALNRYMKTKGIGADISSVTSTPLYLVSHYRSDLLARSVPPTEQSTK
jgi:hypothetical protein